MPNLFKRTKETPLDDEIARLHTHMLMHEPGSPEYTKDLVLLERLSSIRKEKRVGVSPDTKAIVLGNLAGILVIVGYERMHVVATKAVTMLLKSQSR